jgi:formate hydrogenlyase transcriptional activator
MMMASSNWMGYDASFRGLPDNVDAVTSIASAVHVQAGTGQGVIARGIHEVGARREAELRKEHNFDEIIGTSPQLLKLLDRVQSTAPTDATVLIIGETGSGKELIARAIHNRSARRDSPLVKVNCGAIPSGLGESELFGHVKGAFTSAYDRRIGRFESANNGTLFLDEVGELPLEIQVKLLRVLQEQEFEPVGSHRTIKVNVRIIAATNRDLEKAVQSGAFRTDLYYRLNVIPLRVPALRKRRSDIPEMVMAFLQQSAKRMDKPVQSVSRETLRLLIDYFWPGNIRELQFDAGSPQ